MEPEVEVVNKQWDRLSTILKAELRDYADESDADSELNCCLEKSWD